MSFKTQAWFVAGGLLALGAVVVLYQVRSRPPEAPVQIPEEPTPVLSAKPPSTAGEFHLPIEELVARRDEIVPDRVTPKELERTKAQWPATELQRAAFVTDKPENPKPIIPGEFVSSGHFMDADPGPSLPTTFSPPVVIEPKFTDSPTPSPSSQNSSPPSESPPPAPTVPEPTPELPLPDRLRPETAPPPSPIPPSASPGAMPTPADLTVNRTDRPRKRSEKPCPLTGMHSCKTDDKSGLCLPETVDRALGQPDQLFVAPGANGELIVANTDGIEQMKARETYSTTKGSDDSAVLRHFFSLWERVDVDTTGYVVIPEKLRAVGRPTEMVFVGVGDHFELWTAKAWKDYKNAQRLWRTCIDPFSECRQTGVVTTPPPSGF